MDMQTSDLKVFLMSLTEEQADKCESDEKQLAKIFNEGWSEENAVRFHRAMFHARRVQSSVTVEGLFEVAFHLGLSFIGDEDVLARMNEARDGDVIVYGIHRQNGKSGSVLMDGATVVKINPKRVWGRKKGQVRGV